MQLFISISKLLATAILLSFAGVLLVSTFKFSQFHEHGMLGSMVDCPFMSHEETLCPMTALDHLTTLRSLFETVLPSFVTLTLIGGVALIIYFNTPKPKLRLHIHAFWRWRASVIYRFSPRPYQDLFSQGILHPKLFS